MNTTYNLSANRTTISPIIDEATMVRLSQKGDQEMFASLYDTYLERIYRYVCCRVGDEHLAEDITSQVFLKAWENLASYQVGQSPFISWLYRIAHNAVIDHYRAKKITVPLEEISLGKLSHHDNVDERLDGQIQSKKLRDALKTLTDEQQQVLLLKFVGGMSTEEIAHHLGKHQGAIRALQMRGLQGLAKLPTLQREQIYG